MKPLYFSSSRGKCFASVGVFLCLVWLCAATARAATLTEAAAQIAGDLAAENPDTKAGIVINVFHYITKKDDAAAEEIAGELFIALRKQFPKAALQDVREAGLAGNSLDAVWLDVAYEPKGHDIRLTAEAKTGMAKNVIKKTVTSYLLKQDDLMMMGIFEMKSETLAAPARKAFTKTFRAEMSRSGFRISSDTETQQKQMEELSRSGCSAEKCIIEVGKINKMTHVVDLEYVELGRGVFQLTATIHDLKSGSSVSEYAQHDGDPATINAGIRELVSKLVPIFFKQQEDFSSAEIASAEKNTADSATFMSRFQDNWVWHTVVLAGILGTSQSEHAMTRQYHDLVAENV